MTTIVKHDQLASGDLGGHFSAVLHACEPILATPDYERRAGDLRQIASSVSSAQEGGVLS